MSFRTLGPIVLSVVASSVPALAQAYRAVHDAQQDPVLSAQPSGFLSLPGVATDFARAGGGQLVELPNGNARLTCRVFSLGNLYGAFLLDLTLSGRVAPGDPGHPPAGAPDLSLLPSAYAPAGPVDPGTFVYYTAASGTLTGVRNFAGALLTLTATAPVQLGLGASNRNGGDGLSGAFQVAVVQQPPFPLTPTGAASLAADFVLPYDEATTHPKPEPTLSTLPADRALALPGVADDYVFVPAGDFRERADGTALLTGTLRRLSDLDDGFWLQLSLSGRVDPGQAGHPPAGAPVLQMLPSAYAAAGGPIDPQHWHYYTSASGTLTGVDDNAGALVDLVALGPLQVGGGANGANAYFGLHGALAASVATQPAGHTLTITGPAALFAVTAVFPVLPFPTLATPPTPPALPTVTDQAVVLQGDHLAWLELCAVGFDVFGPGDERDWFDGWFRIVDNQHVEVHPPPGKAPGVYPVLFFNPATQSNTVQVDLVPPASAALYNEPVVPALGTVHVRLHHGPVTGPTLCLVVWGQTPTPSVFPGLASLGIGAGFTDLLLDPNVYAHDPLTGVAAADYGPVPPSLVGSYYYFQGLILDVGAMTLPLPPTNVYRVDFQN